MSSGGTPLCTGCGRPVEGDGYYCPHCGAAVRNVTPYVPYVNIPFNYAPLGSLSEDAGTGGHGVVHWLMFAVFSIILLPIYAIGLPFILAEWIRNRKKRRS